MGPASPSQRLSAGSSRSRPASQTTASTESKAPTSQERYVVANSPSKLRALAALHSTSGSPNKRSSATGLASTASDSSRPAAPPLFFESLQAKSAGQASSQKKAANPFASPQKGAFGAFEREERERLRAKRAELKKQRRVSSSSSVLGKGATSAGAGWGTATLVPADERTPFARSASRSSASGMDLDEVDDFFGGGGASRQRSPREEGQGGALGDGEQQYEEDESLGPSPVKPATGSASLGSDLAPPFRPFQPLIPDRPPPSSASSSTRQPSQTPSARPRPFLAPLPTSQTGVASSVALKSESKVPQKRADPSDRADAFHADQAEKPDAKRKKVAGGTKVPESATSTANGKGKGTAKRAAKAVAVGAVQRGPIGEIVVEVGGSDEGEDEESESSAASGSDAEAEGGAQRVKKKRVRKPTERIVIHDKAAMARQKALERQERYREREGGGDDDGDAADEEGELEAIDVSTTRDEDRQALEDDFPDTSLFGPARQVDLLAKLGARPRSRSRSRSPSTREADEQAALAASLPADLAEILSLRTSPSKAHVSSAKARQVARILGEPSGRRATGRMKPGGLLDFASDDEDGVGHAEDDVEGDDDWDEEVDGWEGAGEAMDGYYSGGEY